MTKIRLVKKIIKNHFLDLEKNQRKFVPGKSRIPLAFPPYGANEVFEALDSMMRLKTTMDTKVRKFEREFAKYVGTKHSIMVNSGSSANLLAFQCLINPYRKKRLKRGDEVLIPSICWPTSLWPIIQSGLKPIFVDVDKETLNINLKDLENRIGNITIGYTKDRKPIYAKDLNAQGPMTVLLKEAIRPNVTQTLENNPAIIHGGPFGNIAHGCNSVIATKTGLKLADYVVTEAGFGADLGAEKFLNIKCRKSGLKPDCVVVVATIRALKMHGGLAKDELKKENVKALKKGLVNLERHISNVQKFGLPVAVAVNHFITDTEQEVKALVDYCKTLNVKAKLCTHWSNGGEGTKELADYVVELCENKKNKFKFLYENSAPLFKKIETIAKEIYYASEVVADTKVREQLKNFQENGYGELPICIAKTQFSFSTDPSLKGAPSGHVLPIREVSLSSGAEFIVVVCGAIMTMPGLPRIPAANSIKLNNKGEIEGLF